MSMLPLINQLSASTNVITIESDPNSLADSSQIDPALQ